MVEATASPASGPNGTHTQLRGSSSCTRQRHLSGTSKVWTSVPDRRVRSGNHLLLRLAGVNSAGGALRRQHDARRAVVGFSVLWSRANAIEKHIRNDSGELEAIEAVRQRSSHRVFGGSTVAARAAGFLRDRSTHPGPGNAVDRPGGFTLVVTLSLGGHDVPSTVVVAERVGLVMGFSARGHRGVSAGSVEF